MYRHALQEAGAPRFLTAPENYSSISPFALSNCPAWKTSATVWLRFTVAGSCRLISRDPEVTFPAVQNSLRGPF